MTRKEKRTTVRIDSLNLLKVSVDENEIAVNHGMGRTLSISESWILLETYFKINLDRSLPLTLTIEDDRITINGNVFHCNSGKVGMFETGVQFLDRTVPRPRSTLVRENPRPSGQEASH